MLPSKTPPEGPCWLETHLSPHHKVSLPPVIYLRETLKSHTTYIHKHIQHTHTTHTLTFTYTYIHIQLNTSYLFCITLYACFRADFLILSDKLVYRSLRKDCISYSRHSLANCRTLCWVEALWSFLLACHYIRCCFSLVHG